MRWRRTLARVLDGAHDAAIRFDDLRTLLRRLGFDEQIRGSHHVFRRDDVPERLVLQRDGSSAKLYQVRHLLRRFPLGGPS